MECCPTALCASSTTTSATLLASQTWLLTSFSKTCGVMKKTRWVCKWCKGHGQGPRCTWHLFCTSLSSGRVAYLPSGFAQLWSKISSHERCHFRRNAHNSVHSVDLLPGKRLGRSEEDDDFLWKPAEVV